MILRFEEWLIRQTEREDVIGELARAPGMRDVNEKTSKRMPDEHRSWADIVTRIAEPGINAVFNEAWQEFLLAKEAAAEPVT